MLMDPVRVSVAGIEVEGRIEAVKSSMLRVHVGRRLLQGSREARLRGSFSQLWSVDVNTRSVGSCR